MTSDPRTAGMALSAADAVETRSPAAPAATTGSWPPIAKTFLRIGLTVGILVLLFWQVSWSNVWNAASAINPALLLSVCVLWLPTQYLQFVKWDLMARQAGPAIRRADIHRGYWVGFTLGLITPGRIGQLGRGFALHNCSLSRALGATAVERGYTALVINAFGLLSLVALPLLGWIPPLGVPYGTVSWGIAAIGMLLLALGIFPRSMLGPLRWIAQKLPLRDKLEKAVDVLSDAGPARGILLLLLTIAALFSSLFQFVLLIHAMGVPVPVFAGMLAALLTFFIKGAIPISFGSLGVGEWTAVYCFRGLGVEPSVAVAASLLLFIINVFIPSLIGLPFINSLRALPWNKSGGAST